MTSPWCYQVPPTPFVERLEGYVRDGGRALIEFADPESGALFGVQIGGALLFARHERMVVSSRISDGGLPVGTLMDEQYSHVLPTEKLPLGIVRVLDYGEIDGSYPDGKSLLVGAVGRDLGERKWPALVKKLLDLGRPSRHI